MVLQDENHLYGIILVHLTSNTALKKTQTACYRIFLKSLKLKFSSNCLLSSLDMSHTINVQS